MITNNTSLTRDDIVATVKAIWVDVLQKNDLCLDDHFLDVGGDSLGAMLCISKIRNECEVELTFEDFFLDHATVLGLSKIISDERKLPE